MKIIYTNFYLKIIIICIVSLIAKFSFGQTYVMPKTGTVTQTTCSGTFVDSGGSGGNYSTNENGTITFCSSTPGQSIIVNFISFNTIPGTSSLLSSNPGDVLQVFDGATTAGTLLGTYCGPYPIGTFTSTGSCITFQFTSGTSGPKPGWSAVISCGARPAPTRTYATDNTDCVTKRQVCDLTKRITSGHTGSATGSVADLNSTCCAGGAGNEGCLSSGERSANWYYFTITQAGTLDFTIFPDAGSDYDFAIWGPTVAPAAPVCPPNTLPLRCSYYAGASATGITSLEVSTDVSESAGGSGNILGMVYDINTLVGETYLLYIDNFSATSTGFALVFSGTAGLDCSVAILPIDLLSFTAKKDYANVALAWKTASEKNNIRFDIEKSIDGLTFTTLGSVVGAGNSNITRSYTYTDRSASGGLTYYRLKQVDVDGKETDSQIISINNSTSGNIVTIIPNPLPNGATALTINYDAVTDAAATVSVRNVIGQEILRKQFSLTQGFNALDISLDGLNLSSSMYFIQVQTPVDIETQRLLITK